MTRKNDVADSLNAIEFRMKDAMALLGHDIFMASQEIASSIQSLANAVDGLAVSIEESREAKNESV